MASLQTVVHLLRAILSPLTLLLSPTGRAEFASGYWGEQAGDILRPLLGLSFNRQFYAPLRPDHKFRSTYWLHGSAVGRHVNGWDLSVHAGFF